MINFDEAFWEDLEDNDWYDEIIFEEVADFRATGMYSAVRSVESDGYLGVTFNVYDEDEGIKQSQKNAFIYFYENQKRVLDALCLGVIREYPKLMEIYGEEEFDDDYFPKIRTIDDVKKIIGLSGLYIFDDELEGYSYYGIGGGCTWDEEHGFGAILYKDEVIEVSDEAQAFSPSFEVDRHRHKRLGTYDVFLKEEAEREAFKIQLREEFDKRKEEAETKAAEKKWWEFWK